MFSGHVRLLLQVIWLRPLNLRQRISGNGYPNVAFAVRNTTEGVGRELEDHFNLDILLAMSNTAEGEGMNALVNNRGQGLIEYLLIFLLIVIVVIVMVKGVGSSTSDMYKTVTSSVSSAFQ